MRETRLSHGTMDPRLAAALRKTACPGPGPQCRSDPIELSNACRAFYNSRLESARVLRERWSRSGSESYQKTGEGTAGTGSDKNENCRKKSSIDIAMDTLRQEMASLMEQDLSLMRQLLTLNEEIEELKWRRRYCWSRASSSAMTSSGDVDLGSLASFTSSEASLGWRQESGDLLTKYPGISSLSLHADHARLSVYDEEDPMGTFNRHVARSKGSQRTLSAVGGNQTFQQQQQQLQQQQQQQSLGENQTFQQQQQLLQQQQQQQLQSRTGWGRGEEKESEKEYAERESFDSGIHEGYTDTSLHTNSTTEVTHM